MPDANKFEYIMLLFCLYYIINVGIAIYIESLIKKHDCINSKSPYLRKISYWLTSDATENRKIVIMSLFGLPLLIINLVTFLAILTLYYVLKFIYIIYKVIRYLDDIGFGLFFWLELHYFRLSQFVTLLHFKQNIKMRKISLTIQVLTHITLKISGFEFNLAEKKRHKRRLKAIKILTSDIDWYNWGTLPFIGMFIVEYVETKIKNKTNK